MICRQMTSFPLAALPCLTSSHLRITQRLNPERGPHAVPTDPSMAFAAKYVERSAGTNSTRSWPPENMLARHGGMAPPLPFIYPTAGAALSPHLVSFATIRGPEDMLSSQLGQHILSYEPPCGFAILSFHMYDGSSDPYDHMLHFNQVMILSAGNDRLLCKVFLTNLKGPALAWFHKLLRGSINSFNELWVAFISQYLCSVW